MPRIYFAWVDPSETTYGPQHKIEDEEVTNFDVTHEEGDFAVLTVTFRNPRIGFLHASRKQWAWLSIDDTPLFFGRLVGIPASINKEAVTCEFQARPSDYQDQKEAIAVEMRDLPYYDPVWFTFEAQQDPDTVLEARPERWHIDRVTGELTSSHILVGEDGLKEFQPIEIPYDSVEITIGQVPSRAIQVTGDVSWGQKVSGSIDLGTFIVNTYTGKSLYDAWPKAGVSLGGGWMVTASNIRDNYQLDTLETRSFSVSWSNEAASHSNGDTLSTSISSTTVTPPGDYVQILLTSSGSSGEQARTENTSLIIPEWALTGSLSIGYDTTRDRKETIAFTMVAHFQNLITLPDENDVEILAISGGDVGVATQIPGAEYGETEIPIGNVKNRSYFTTGRGTSSLEWLILRARSQMMLSSRAVEVECEIPFARAIELSNRMNGRIHDHRLPGGIAEGKIIKYGFSSDGDSATRIGTVTIACSIGYGGTVVEVPGDPDYCDDDYVEPDYQYHTGSTVVLDASDIGYTPPAFANGVDDGLHFPLSRGAAVKDASIIGDVAAQKVFIESFQTVGTTLGLGGKQLDAAIAEIAARSNTVPKQIDDGLKQIAHYLSLRLVNLEGGPFENLYNVTLTQLELPKGIDLEAASS